MFTLSEGSKWNEPKSQEINYFKYLIYFPGGSPTFQLDTHTETGDLRSQAHARAEVGTSCGTSHPAAPGQLPGAPQPDSAESSTLAHSACRILCKYSAEIPGAF